MDFDCGDILIQEGEHVDGIYLITSGMVRLFGRGLNPGMELNVEDEYGDGWGDDKDNLYSNTNKFDYVCSGGLVGEVGIMTRNPSDITAVCETAVSAYLIK